MGGKRFLTFTFVCNLFLEYFFLCSFLEGFSQKAKLIVMYH